MQHRGVTASKVPHKFFVTLRNLYSHQTFFIDFFSARWEPLVGIGQNKGFSLKPRRKKKACKLLHL